jgi:hypothetical protein
VVKVGENQPAAAGQAEENEIAEADGDGVQQRFGRVRQDPSAEFEEKQLHAAFSREVRVFATQKPSYFFPGRRKKFAFDSASKTLET